jgi:hypothetical protein
LAKPGVGPTLADKQRGGAAHSMLGGGRPQRPQLQRCFTDAGGDRVSLSDDLVAERRLETAEDREPSGE